MVVALDDGRRSWGLEEDSFQPFTVFVKKGSEKLVLTREFTGLCCAGLCVHVPFKKERTCVETWVHFRELGSRLR